MNGSEPASLSRRRLLAAAGAAGAGLAAGPVAASAQENGSDGGTESGEASRINTRAIMPETGRISADQNYTGFFLQLTNRLEDTQVGGIEECDYANWDPGNTDVFETQLINKIGDDTETIASSVYLPHRTDLRTGDLFVIDNQHECPEGAYIGVRLEQMRAGNVERGYGQVESGGGGDGGEEGGDGGGGGGDSSGAVGPGFGPLATVGGIAGGAYALLRRSDGE